MDEDEKLKTEYGKLKSPIFNKVIFDGINKNNNNPSSVKAKTFVLNFRNSNSTRNNKKLLRYKKIASAPFIKRHNIDKFKYYFNNSNKEIQASNFNKKNTRLFSAIKISTPFNQNNALYKNLKMEIFHKNFGRTSKNSNFTLFKNVTTNYLRQKVSDNIPILYPFYSSFNKIYKSKSQRERYIKNMDKLVKVRTHLSKNKNDHYKIITEFMIKNGVNETKYINAENMRKMENYLRQPINFDSNLTMTQIIKNVINNQFINANMARNSPNKKLELKLSNNMQPREEIRKEKNNMKNEIKLLKKGGSSPNIDLSYRQNDLRIIRLIKRFDNLENKKNLNVIVNNLDNELKKIKSDKINKFAESNKYDENKIYLMKSYEDHNKFVPNLCLSSKGFSERYKNNIDRFNNKIKSIMSKNERIKSINKRMYYDNKQNKSLKEFDLSDIRKYHKITELVFLNRGKKELLKREIKNLKYQDNIKKSKLFFKSK